MAQLNPCQLDDHDPTFLDMFDRIHVDEKWFYVMKMANKFYLAACEAEPHHTCKSKSFITKVMFLAVVSQPRWDSSHNQYFNGKLGIWPFVKYVAAKHGSRNRPKGTIETKAMTSVTNMEYAQFITDKLLPAIRDKWPRSCPYHQPKIQPDNARPHVQPINQRFLDAVASIGMNVQLAYHPSNSPDMNILNLDFFNAIQLLQHQQRCKNIDELIATIEKAYTNVPHEKFNNVFLLWQQCMIEVLKVGGSNNYKVPHMGKYHLEHARKLPTCLECNMNIVNTTRQALLG